MRNFPTSPRSQAPKLPLADSEDLILAAIDIGTNSIHMVVVQIDPHLATFTIIAREKDTVRLGECDRHTGNLTPEAMERALAALSRCQELARSFQAQHTVAIATSATREAPNGRAFLQRIESELGLFVNLISGQEEARRIYLGVLSGLEFGEDPHIIVDIGGGSTEVILADSREARFLSSIKIGAVRLTSERVTTDPISSNELASLQAHVRMLLERPVEQVRSRLLGGERPRLVGTSGTIETLAALNALEKLGTIPVPLNGYILYRAELQDLVNRLIAMSYQERLALPGLIDKRAEIIVPGAIILLEAMNLLDLDALTICERALREGMIVDWMLSHGIISDRWRYQSEVRERSVRKLAHKYQVNLSFGEQVAKFALQIFDRLQGHLHFWGDSERQLLWAAAILHNCGLFISHSSHHKHSYYLIRNGELLGFNDMEMEVIANIARYHRKSKPKKKHEFYNNLPKVYRQMVSQLSAILRLAAALDRRQIGAIAKLDCDYYPEEAQLRLYLFPAQPDDDCALEQWSLNAKKEVFEEEFEVKVLPTLVSLAVGEGAARSPVYKNVK